MSETAWSRAYFIRQMYNVGPFWTADSKVSIVLLCKNLATHFSATNLRFECSYCPRLPQLRQNDHRYSVQSVLRENNWGRLSATIHVTRRLQQRTSTGMPDMTWLYQPKRSSFGRELIFRSSKLCQHLSCSRKISVLMLPNNATRRIVCEGFC
jgi:hypothetical protein